MSARAWVIWIVSGEGTTGTRDRYDGAVTVRALESRLTRERAGGDRWARCEIETEDRYAEECTPEQAIHEARR